MIGIISKNNKISNVEPGVTLNIYDPIGVFYNEIAHYFIIDIILPMVSSGQMLKRLCNAYYYSPKAPVCKGFKSKSFT